MTGSNHMVAGALIATTTTQPLIVLPLAFLSHFVMDALPHYGDNNNHSWLGRHFNVILLVDAIITTLFIIGLLIGQPVGWGLMIIAGLVALSPDLVWLPHYIANLKGSPKHHGWFARFSKWIQWGERPWGIYIEIVVFLIGLTVFINIVS